MCSVKKKLLASLLIVILLLSTIPVTVFAITPTVVTDEAGLKTAAQNGGEVTIGDCENDCLMLSEPIIVNKDMVIDMNGKSIYFQSGSEGQAMFIVSGATLTINGGEGSRLTCHGAGSIFMLVGVAGKETDLILNKGNYEASAILGQVYAKPKSLVDVQCESNAITPKIVFNGGGYSVEGENSSSGGALFSGDSANITIKEGGFSVDPTAYLDSKSYCFPEESAGGSWKVLVIAEQFSKDFKSILDDKNQLVLNRYKPTAEEGPDILFEALGMQYSGNEEEPQFCFYKPTYNAEEETVYCSLLDKDTWEVLETHKVKLVFNYDTTMKAEIDKLIAKLPKGEDMGGWFDTYYFKVTDMELINYWLTCTETNRETNVNQLINYSDEFKKQIGYKNFSLEVGMGMDEDLLTEAAGFADFKYKGVVYGVLEIGARAEHILYVPDDAQDVLAAAQERLDDYLGAGKVKLEESTVPNTTDKCYKTIINNIEHYLLIEKDSSKIVTPTYQNIDVATNIVVMSEDSSIPLDTMLEVEKLTSGNEYDRVMDILDVKKSETFDIKLRSGSLDKYVTKLENGQFKVTIPIPETWDGESLAVYYVDENDKEIEHEVTQEVMQGKKYATFYTNHFSIYTLAVAKTNDTIVKAPATGDSNGIMAWAVVALVSGIMMTAVVVSDRKKR